MDLYAGDVFLEEAFGLNVYAATAILLLITGLYTLFGMLIKCSTIHTLGLHVSIQEYVCMTYVCFTLFMDISLIETVA